MFVLFQLVSRRHQVSPSAAASRVLSQRTLLSLGSWRGSGSPFTRPPRSLTESSFTRLSAANFWTTKGTNQTAPISWSPGDTIRTENRNLLMS